MGDIVVGVDGSAASLAALRWAVEEAALRDVSVEACHAWHVAYTGDGAPPDPVAVEAAARRVLAAAVGAVEAERLPKPVVRTLIRGVAASALLDAGRGAALLVLGGANGAVARHVLAYAPCPVVIVTGAS